MQRSWDASWTGFQAGTCMSTQCSLIVPAEIRENRLRIILWLCGGVSNAPEEESSEVGPLDAQKSYASCGFHK